MHIIQIQALFTNSLSNHGGAYTINLKDTHMNIWITADPQKQGGERSINFLVTALHWLFIQYATWLLQFWKLTHDTLHTTDKIIRWILVSVSSRYCLFFSRWPSSTIPNFIIYVMGRALPSTSTPKTCYSPVSVPVNRTAPQVRLKLLWLTPRVSLAPIQQVMQSKPF